MSAPGAARDAILNLGRPSGPQRLLLVDESIFEQYQGRPPQRVGPLFDHLRVFAALYRRPAAANAGVLERARRCIEQVEEYRFVLKELLPLLRSVAANRSGTLADLEKSARHFRQFEQRAALLRNLLGSHIPELGRSGLTSRERARLERLIGLPVSLVGMAAIPLQLVPRAAPWDLHVEIGSQRFRYAIERARPVKELLQAVSHAEEWVSQRMLAQDPTLKKRVTELLASSQALLSAYGLTGRGLQIPVRGMASFEIQYRSGSWVLVYGPESPRTRQGPPVYVGVSTRGRTRSQRLSVAPVVSTRVDGFFSPNGEPLQGGICMGGAEQYARLSSSALTDAEAQLYWLDAAVVVATGRSAFHQQWRDQGGRHPGTLYPF